MPPPEFASLSEDDLIRLRGAVESGKRPRVYLRDAVPSLGIAAASSAQVVAVQDGMVTVRPKGVGDDVPFESGELYTSRAAAINAASNKAASNKAAANKVATPASPRRTRAARPSTSAPKTPPATRVSVTINGTAAGAWTVHSAHGAHKLGSPAPVPVDAVIRAVAALGDRTAVSAVDAVRNHAQHAAAARVAELSAELQRAEAALRALEQR